VPHNGLIFVGGTLTPHGQVKVPDTNFNLRNEEKLAKERKYASFMFNCWFPVRIF